MTFPIDDAIPEVLGDGIEWGIVFVVIVVVVVVVVVNGRGEIMTIYGNGVIGILLGGLVG